MPLFRHDDGPLIGLDLLPPAEDRALLLIERLTRVAPSLEEALHEASLSGQLLITQLGDVCPAHALHAIKGHAEVLDRSPLRGGHEGHSPEAILNRPHHGAKEVLADSQLGLGPSQDVAAN